jgi:hypothetical protein
MGCPHHSDAASALSRLVATRAGDAAAGMPATFAVVEAFQGPSSIDLIRIKDSKEPFKH